MFAIVEDQQDTFRPQKMDEHFNESIGICPLLNAKHSSNIVKIFA